MPRPRHASAPLAPTTAVVAPNRRAWRGKAAAAKAGPAPPRRLGASQGPRGGAATPAAFPAGLLGPGSRFGSSLGLLTKKFVHLLKRAASHGTLENRAHLARQFRKRQGGAF